MKYFFSFLLLGTFLYAQTLDVLIEEALAQSSQIRQSRASQELAKLGHREKKAEQYGAFDLVGSYTHYNLPRTLAPLTPDVMASGVPITTTKDLYSAGVAYTVPLFTGFAQTRSVEIEHIAKEMADAKMKLTKEQLVYNIRVLYLSALSLTQMREAQEAYADALKKLQNQIAYEVKLGKKAKIDLLKAKAAYEGAKAQVRALAANIKITKATLSALAGTGVDKLYPVKISVQKSSYDVAALREKISNLTKVQVENLNLQKAQKMVSKSRAKRYPQVALSAYLGKNYGEDLKRNDMDDETLWQAGLNVKYNLFDFGKSSIATQKAKIARLQATIHKDQTLLDLQKRLIEALAQIERNEALYRGNKAAYALSVESEKIETVRYEQGASTLNDLLLAKGKSRQVEAKMIQSRYDYQKSIYFLDYLLERGVHEDQ